MFHQILVATDGSESATRAVETATEVALEFSAKLLILNVGAVRR
jgi:nucleotide-binding universal stress UspA family protein